MFEPVHQLRVTSYAKHKQGKEEASREKAQVYCVLSVYSMICMVLCQYTVCNEENINISEAYTNVCYFDTFSAHGLCVTGKR